MTSSPLFLDPVIVPLIVGKTVLDAGCGVGRWGSLIRSNYWEAGLARPPEIDGLDAWQLSVDACARSGHYRRVWQQTLPSVIEGRWDTVLAVEVIEHVSQERVHETLDHLERAAAKRVIVTTPNWPFFRPGGDSPLGFSSFEAHLSYVPRSLFTDRGYKLLGAGMSMNPHSLLGRAVRKARLAGTLESLPRRLPSIGDLIVAYRDQPYDREQLGVRHAVVASRTGGG